MFRTLLPPNSTKLERDLETSMAKAYDLPVAIDKLWSADNCPLELLPYLAWAISVDTWNSDWPEQVKRNVIASSAYVHRHKGTGSGIKVALDALDLGVSISEWFEHEGDPFTFKADVVVKLRGLSEREYEDILSVIASTKNARSHLSALRIYLTTNNTNRFALCSVIGESMEVFPWSASVATSNTSHKFAAASITSETITVGEAA